MSSLPQGVRRKRADSALGGVGWKQFREKNALITSWKINMEPQKRAIVKGNFIFQPSIFQGYVSFQGGTFCKRNILNLKHGRGWKIIFFCNSLIFK